MLYENPTSHDLELSAGSLRTVEDGSATAVSQKVLARLLTHLSEWFLDLDFGTDYRGRVWDKQTPIQVRDAHLQQQALLSAGQGSKITRYEADVDGLSRQLTVVMDVQLAGGQSVIIEV